MKLAALAIVAGLSMPAFGQQESDLPLSRLTLYRSGVGFFERRGQINGAADVQLAFDADQINDILKSMVLLDLDGGRIEAVGYGSREPLNRRLASFGIDISDEPGLAKLLTRLRGAPVALDLGVDTEQGVVLGVEMRKNVYQEGVAVEEPYVNLLTSEGVRPIDLTLVRSMRILDEELDAELNKALAALAEQRADRVKTVDIALRGEGLREVVAAYIHEMPMWKTSYRLVLPQVETDGAGSSVGAGQPTIQGWAIVENTTDEDWNDIRLALVAGRPVSFRMDLYEPLHVERPELPVPTVPGVAPRVYEGGEVFAAREAPSRDRADERGRAGGKSYFAEAESSAPRAISADDMLDYAAQAQASATEAGEIFQYELEAPVTIERQRSAMLPILSAPIEGRRVSIYNRADGSRHPMRGVEITNTSSLQIMPGPISVFDAGAYAGDAQIGYVGPGETRLLAHAIDLPVQAVVEDDGTSRVQRIRIVDGMIEQRIARSQSTRYAFSNSDARDRAVIVEHPKIAGWDLASPEEPAGETESLYRFEVDVAPDAKGEVTVRQQRTDFTRLEVVSYDLEMLAGFVSNGAASEAVLEAVREAARLNSAILETERSIAALDAEVQRLHDDQDRIRRNMGALDRRSDAYNRYVTKLGEQEDRLEEIRTERVELESRLVEQRSALAHYLRDLDVE